MSISVEHISKTFKNKRKSEEPAQVLKDVSFEVGEGEFVSLLGPSGCGKTTTLTIIAGFQKPDEGKIVVSNEKNESCEGTAQTDAERVIRYGAAYRV